MSERAERTRATAVITVHKYEPSAYDEPAEGPVLTQVHVEESFAGDIAGGGVEFLQAGRADGPASFVGTERVTGEIGGRRGTFLLQDAGTVHDNIVSADWLVIPARAPQDWPACAARAGSAPASAKAPRCTRTTGSDEPPARDLVIPLTQDPGMPALTPATCGVLAPPAPRSPPEAAHDRTPQQNWPA